MNREIPPCPGPDRNLRKPTYALPRGGWDTMAHIFGPTERYPLSPDRSYQPEDCPLEDYLAYLDTMGFDYGVLVQGGAHGTDNSAMLNALEREPKRLRGVAVFQPGRPPGELQRMHDLGVRGVRMTTVVGGGVKFDQLEALAKEVHPYGWHTLLHFLNSIELLDVEPILRRMANPFVLDHLGRIRGEEGVASPAFQTILRLLDTDRCWVRISSFYRLSSQAWPYNDMRLLVDALVAARPDRLIWGSNWPHPIMFNQTPPNDADLVDTIPIWIESDETRERILVHNPLVLYG